MEVSMSRGCRSLCPRRRRNCESKRSSHSTARGLQSIINSFSEARKQPAVVPLNWKGAWRISGDGRDPHGSA